MNIGVQQRYMYRLPAEFCLGLLNIRSDIRNLLSNFQFLPDIRLSGKFATWHIPSHCHLRNSIVMSMMTSSNVFDDYNFILTCI